MAKTIPLGEIDKAIRLNCAIKPGASKALTLKVWQGVNNSGLGRCLFIYIALNAGYEKDAICDYLGINEHEFEQKSNNLPELYANGRLLFESFDGKSNYQDSRDGDLFFYRKLILICNYLRFRYDFTI